MLPAALMAAVAFAAAPAVSAADKSEALVIAVPELPQERDPQLAVRDVDLAAAAELFMGLVTRDAQGKLIPGAAERWDISSDQLTYTFALRRGLQWSDGSALDAEDFVAGFRHALAPSPGAPFAGSLAAIQGAQETLAGTPRASLGVSAPDSRTVRITLKHPSATFLATLALPVAMPVPHRRGERTFARESQASNGPFMAQATEDGVTLVKNPHFFAANDVKIPAVTFVTAPSSDEAIEMVRTRAAQLTWGFSFMPPPPRARGLKAEAGSDLLFVAVNARKPLLNRRENRHALAMTIDREAFVRSSRLENAAPAYTMVPPQLAGAATLHRAAYAPLTGNMRSAVAEVLLEEAQVSRAQPVTLQFRYPKGAATAAFAKAVTAGWPRIGITAQLQEDGPAEFAEALRRGDFDLALTTWPARAEDAFGFLTPLTREAGPWNMGGYEEPEFNKRMQAAVSETDPVIRPQATLQAENVLIEDQIILPVVFFTPLRPVAVEGWQPNALGVHPLRFLAR
ncbi:MAG: peptide ABC transporter substrate-binding protein [Rhodospirillaceae bacterium]|nr:peptide ABC transporter substrate-binding protein [Rhodospirillaceae bacterium]